MSPRLFSRLWTSENKEQEIFNGSEFKFTELPGEVFVEGVDRGTGGVELRVAGGPASLFTGMVYPFESIPKIVGSDRSDSDKVLVTAGLGLTAYRPMQGPNDYKPFKKTAVKEAHEEDSKLGPGIRLNGDDDNSDGIRDYDDELFLGQVANENDLIEVRIDAAAYQAGYKLRRSSDVIHVWTHYLREGKVYFTNQVSDEIEFDGSGIARVFVEWAQFSHGEATMELIDTNTSNEVIDTLKFHSFQGIAIGLSGEKFFDLGSDPATDSGLFTIATKLYETGYDSQFHNEDAVGTIFSAVFLEVRNAIENRNVRHIAIYGHSLGGGATYDLVDLINGYYINGGYGFDIAITAYIDAITRPGILPEDRRPHGGPPFGSLYHVNYYQLIDTPHGVHIEEGVANNTTVNIEVNQLNWNDDEGNDLVHDTIDDSHELHVDLIGRINQKMTR